jgi:hypothetical protein
MNSKTSTLILIKNLIENENLNRVYELKGEFYWTNKSIYDHISYFNFGLALLEIENELFDNLKDEDFRVAQEIDEDFEENNGQENYNNVNFSSNDQTDWSHYNDDLDMDQQSEDFWNQF